MYGTLQLMPTSANLALSEVATAGADGAGSATKGAGAGGGESGGVEAAAAVRSALGKLLRSKGFMWLAFSDKAAMYWSHAGERVSCFCRPSELFVGGRGVGWG